MMLEEAEESKAAGVFVKAFGETGSAVEYADQLRGAKLLSVGGVDVATADFETVMDLIIQTESSTVQIEFNVASAATAREPVAVFAVGTPVTVIVQQGNGKPDLILNTKVGDNLRSVLFDGGFEVYQGMKQKLGNCGGAGQCTFCAVDFLESEGWDERSNYEDRKLTKFPSARLSCLNSIQGPITIKKTQR
jgi:ferredoxin